MRRPRPHLTLVAGFENVTSVSRMPIEPATPSCAAVSPARLAADVVTAALAWAAEVDTVENGRDDLPAPQTPMEQARRRLLDAVYTMEYHVSSVPAMRIRQ